MQKSEDYSGQFNIDRSEEINVADLHLMDKNTTLPTQGQKIYISNFQQQSRPLSVILKPYVETFLKGAGTTATTVAGLGQQALQVVSGVLWWGFTGLKSLLTKTSEYIKPQFVLLTNKKQPNQEQLELIDKLQRNKDMAVLGINELNELKPVQGAKCQVVIPVDEAFMEYLKNQKFIIRQKDWVGQIDPTKTIMMPSESFRVVIENFEVEGKKSELPNRQVINYGQFCAFELEGKNEIEYQFIEKLRMSKDTLEGYMVRTVDIEKDSSNDSRPDYQSLLVIEQAPEINLNNYPALQEKPKVTVKQVPLQIVSDNEESRQIQLA